MNNIISYLEEFGDRTFEEIPFNEVDSLVLCQLSYLDYSSFVAGLDRRSAPVAVADIYADKDCEKIFEGYWYHDENKKLFKNFVSSKRFKGTMLNYFVSITDEQEDIQFCAVTYVLCDRSAYIAYRGTDATLVGWKEDLKLGYSEPLRSQELAVEYIEKASSYFTGQFRTGGHSKGGNLAVYAAMFCSGECRKRIGSIYDHDGPGFRPEIIKEGHYASIKNKIHKFIPRSSIVGILLENSDDYKVVECWSVGALQHNSYKWKSNGTSFVCSQMSEMTKKNNEAINEWIYSLSDREVDTIIDVVFELLTAKDAKNLFDLAEDPLGNARSAINRYRQLDQRSKDMLAIIIKRLKDLMDQKAQEEFKDKINALKGELKSWQEDASSFMNTAITKKKH